MVVAVVTAPLKRVNSMPKVTINEQAIRTPSFDLQMTICIKTKSNDITDLPIRSVTSQIGTL